MPLFKVSFEDVGYADDEDISGSEMTQIEAKAFTETSRAEDTLPRGVVAVLGGAISTDKEENDGDGDIKRFVAISLLVEADHEEEALEFTPPADFLSKIADIIAGEHRFDLENNWEAVEADEHKAVEAPAP